MNFYSMTFGTALGSPVRARSAEGAARQRYGRNVTVVARSTTDMAWWEVYLDGEWIDDVYLDSDPLG